MKPERLYHFTCTHGQRRIGRVNCLLIPQIEHPLLGCKVTWLTTEAEPDREATGLGHHFTRCDRMEFRYIVTDLRDCRRWLTSFERKASPPGSLTDLESYGDPEHWWIADCAIPAAFDITWSTR